MIEAISSTRKASRVRLERLLLRDWEVQEVSGIRDHIMSPLIYPLDRRELTPVKLYQDQLRSEYLLRTGAMHTQIRRKTGVLLAARRCLSSHRSRVKVQPESPKAMPDEAWDAEATRPGSAGYRQAWWHVRFERRRGNGKKRRRPVGEGKPGIRVGFGSRSMELTWRPRQQPWTNTSRTRSPLVLIYLARRTWWRLLLFGAASPGGENPLEPCLGRPCRRSPRDSLEMIHVQGSGSCVS